MYSRVQQSSTQNEGFSLAIWQSSQNECLWLAVLTLFRTIVVQQSSENGCFSLAVIITKFSKWVFLVHYINSLSDYSHAAKFSKWVFLDSYITSLSDYSRTAKFSNWVFLVSYSKTIKQIKIKTFPGYSRAAKFSKFTPKNKIMTEKTFHKWSWMKWEGRILKGRRKGRRKHSQCNCIDAW